MIIFYIIFTITLWYFLGCLTFLLAQWSDEHFESCANEKERTKKSEYAIICCWPIFLFSITFLLLHEKFEKIHTRFMENLKKFFDVIIKTGGNK